MRTALYARISRDENDQKVGVDRQLVRGAEVAESHEWDVVATFTDNDASAFNGAARPGFDALRSAIEAGDIEVVIVQHQDRLARNVSTFQAFGDLCASHDVKVVTWTGPVDLASAAGRFTSTVQAATDEHYSALISEKARGAHADIARRGEPNGGRRPFGYRRTTFTDDEGKDRRTFAPDPDEAPVVAEVFSRFASGASIRSLAHDLDSRGFTTAGGSKWSTARLRDVLGNPLYIAQRVHRGKVVGPGNWPALVERDLFEMVQGILSKRTKPPGHNVRKYFLAGGLARCGVCGLALVAKPTQRTRRYACKAVADGGCGKISVVADDLEEYVSGVIIEALSDPRVIESVSRRQDSGSVEALSELDRIEARKVELAEMYALGSVNRAQLEAGTARLDEEREGLRAKLPPVSPSLDVGELTRLWNTGEIRWKARVAAVLLNEVLVEPAPVRGRSRFDPDRVRLVYALHQEPGEFVHLPV